MAAQTPPIGPSSQSGMDRLPKAAALTNSIAPPAAERIGPIRSTRPDRIGEKIHRSRAWIRK